MELPFDDSRRLPGPNLYFSAPGVVLELVGMPATEALLGGWRARVARAFVALGWPAGAVVARIHRTGASLALEAPLDQLFTATEVNEWALAATVAGDDPDRRQTLEAAMLAYVLGEAKDEAAVIAPVIEEAAAFARLSRLAADEAHPGLAPLVAIARSRHLQWFVDDDTFTLGAGGGARTYPLSALPGAESVAWHRLTRVPTALVTGSNGKTTTTRLIAACARAGGRKVGYNCTDGVTVDGTEVVRGDYSGPAGARLVLRDARTEVAVLETARGGLLRRGLAVPDADVAVVTNVSADHFGEYGIHDLDALADVKLIVARALAPDGLLVVNADDERLAAKALDLGAAPRAPRLGWFALDADHPLLARHRAAGGATAGVRDGDLVVTAGGREHELAPLSAMPLAVGGHATFNIANLAAAALAALALGVPIRMIAQTFASFGANPADNAGRMMRYARGGAEVLVDYAHNAEGLAGLLDVARRLCGTGRLVLLLGHAGNRRDEDFEALAEVAARYAPARIVVKENEAQLRGRAPGEVPRLLVAALKRAGVPDLAIEVAPTEVDGARAALAAARPGDVVVLPLHGVAARQAIVGELSAPEVA